MAHQTSIRFIIGADGVITEQVEGVKGNQCTLVTGSIEDALGVVTNRRPTMAFYDDEDRLQQLEEEDWIGTCTTWGCAFEPTPIQKTEDITWH